jgi:hypothetical protein
MKIDLGQRAMLDADFMAKTGYQQPLVLNGLAEEYLSDFTFYHRCMVSASRNLQCR